MRGFVIFLTVLVGAGCSRGKHYELEGQVVAVDKTRLEITVRHGDIKGFMPAMTMPFQVIDGKALSERKPGELIKATLVVTDGRGRLENIVRTGEAPLPAGAAHHHSPSHVIEPGETVSDAQFVDQAGRKRRLADWRGKTLAVTFVYTRCPLSDFCPLMDKNFAAVQRSIEEDAGFASRVHLLSVSFDPDYDTPQILRSHAQRAAANDDSWTWLTGERAEIDRFAGQFGVTILRDDRPMPEITHNLRTIVIDREGKIVRILSGNDWKPEELLAALRTADGG